MKNMFQRVKRLFYFESERESNSYSSPKSGRRKEKVVNTDEAEDVPVRSSIVRAPDSLRCNNNVSKRVYSAGEGSLESSREDLLDAPVILSKRKKQNVSRHQFTEYKNCNSSSEDLRYCDSDYTEEPLSTAVVETDGSVFSSRENLSDSTPSCSENVSKFLRRQSSSDSKSDRISSSQLSLNNPLVLESNEFHQPHNKGKDKLDNFKPVYHTKNDRRNYGMSDHRKEILEPPSTAVKGIVSEGSLHPIVEPILSDNVWPVVYKVQMAVTKTIRRLAAHIEAVTEHVELLEKKCSNLKVTLFYLQEDHNALRVKISRLERVIEQRETEQSEESEDDEYLDCIDYNLVGNGNVGSLSLVEHIFKDSTVGKASRSTTSTHLSEADATVATVNSAQDSKTFSAVFTCFSSVAEQIAVS